MSEEKSRYDLAFGDCILPKYVPASLLAHARSCGLSKVILMIQHSEEVHVKGAARRIRPDSPQ